MICDRDGEDRRTAFDAGWDWDRADEAARRYEAERKKARNQRDAMADELGRLVPRVGQVRYVEITRGMILRVERVQPESRVLGEYVLVERITVESGLTTAIPVAEPGPRGADASLVLDALVEPALAAAGLDDEAA